MNILITGANGFIGKNLVEKFQNNIHLCFSPKREELNLLKENEVKSYLVNNKIDLVVHAANVNTTRNRSVSSYNSLDGNLRMFLNLEKCKDYYCKMYYFGSGAEYDMRHYIPDMAEEYFGIHIPQDPYGFSKYIMSKICSQSNNIYDLRLFGVYGKYEEWERRFISNAICRALKGQDIIIQKNIYFDYLWVDDLCNIMLWFVENIPQYKHYNVCRGRKVDLYSLACLVREIIGIDCNILVRESDLKQEYTGSNERLLKEIGDYQFTTFERSIQELCNYYKINIDKIDEDKLI